MTKRLAGELLLNAAGRVTEGFGSRSFAISGDSARCLWMLETLPGRDLRLWKRICHPWPATVTVVGGESPLPADASPDQSAIAGEFGPVMVARCRIIQVPQTTLRLPLVEPAFVLAEILLQDDALRAPRLADLLRCLEATNQVVDPEEVRVLLKAVGAGDRYDLLTLVAAVI